MVEQFICPSCGEKFDRSFSVSVGCSIGTGIRTWESGCIDNGRVYCHSDWDKRRSIIRPVEYFDLDSEEEEQETAKDEEE